MNTTLPQPSATSPAPVRGRSLWADARARLLRNRAALISLVLLAMVAMASVFGPYLSPHPLDEIYWDYIASPPNPAARFYFGTDANGRDLLVRTLYGGRISLMVGLVATLVSLLIGVSYGAVSGYFGGRIDQLIVRLVDILYALPFMFFVILLVVYFGRSIVLIFVAIGAVEWLDMARIVRGQTLSIKRREFIEAAHALGASHVRIIGRHIVPNLVGPVVVFMTLLVPKVILFESFLSFLGLGVQELMTSWGVLISEGATQMESSPWMLVFPATMLATTLFLAEFSWRRHPRRPRPQRPLNKWVPVRSPIQCWKSRICAYVLTPPAAPSPRSVMSVCRWMVARPLEWLENPAPAKLSCFSR